MPGAVFTAQDPRTGAILGSYSDADDETIATACRQAADAAPALRDERLRVRLLREAARVLRAAGPELHELCGRETGLPQARLEGELERTCVQLELLADVVADGSHVEAIIDTADPDAPIAPRPDLRRMLIPIGPVAVFGASNFPYAFSVAGGDTASALAAGCPVVVKAHPSHPGTSGRWRRSCSPRSRTSDSRRHLLARARRFEPCWRGAGASRGDRGGRVHGLARGRPRAVRRGRVAPPADPGVR